MAEGSVLRRAIASLSRTALWARRRSTSGVGRSWSMPGLTARDRDSPRHRQSSGRSGADRLLERHFGLQGGLFGRITERLICSGYGPDPTAGRRAAPNRSSSARCLGRAERCSPSQCGRAVSGLTNRLWVQTSIPPNLRHGFRESMAASGSATRAPFSDRARTARGGTRVRY
jgi:hypothetical protein